MNVDDERLAEELRRGRCLLAACIEPVGVEIPVVNGNLPFAGPQIRRLRLAVSPQTGGCEPDRDSPLREGLPRHEQHTGTDRQDRDEALSPPV
jgi:hypothetical protein